MGRDGGHPRHLLPAALAALAAGRGLAGPGRADRFRAPARFSRPARDLAAGVLHRHRPPGDLGTRPLPGDGHRGARLVRLCLPADGLDGPHGPGRASLAGRPQRPHPARRRRLVAAQDRAEDGHPSDLAADRVAYRWRARVLFPRCTDAGARAPCRDGAEHRLRLPGHLYAGNLPPRRHRPRAGVHLHVPLAPHPRRPVRPRLSARLLSHPPRRAAWPLTQIARLGRARRLHRLQGLCRRVPDGYRHPRRSAARMHSVRAVHRRVQCHHGQSRQAAGPDRL